MLDKLDKPDKHGKIEIHSLSEAEQVLKSFVSEHVDVEAGILGARLVDGGSGKLAIMVFLDPHYDCQHQHPLPKKFGELKVKSILDPLSMMTVVHGYTGSPHRPPLKRRKFGE